MKKTLPLFLLCLLFLVFSCKEDDFQIDMREHGKAEKKKISFREFLQLEGDKPAIEKIKKYFQGNHSGFENKDGDSLNWKIDTSQITQIITPEVTTYTFAVIEFDTISGFRNVIVREYGDQIKTLLVHYTNGVDFENHTATGVMVEEIENFSSKVVQCYDLVYTCLQCGVNTCTVEPGWKIIAVECDGNGGGGENYCVGCPNEPDPTDPGNPTDPTPGGGAPIGDGDGDSSNDPCPTLAQKSTEAVFKQKINFLKTKLNEAKEYGFVNQNPNEQYTSNGQNPPQQTNQYNPTISIGCNHARSVLFQRRQSFGYMHTHPGCEAGSVDIHSPADIKIFMEMVRRRQNAGLSTHDTYGIVVAADDNGNVNVYTLKVENVTSFVNSTDNALTDEFWEEFEDRYETFFSKRDNNSRGENEKALLRLLKKYSDEFGAMGIYRTDGNLTGWNKLSLNENGNQVMETPC